MKSALATLQERGFIQQCTDLEALDRRMAKESVTFYVGLDPTGPSLHVGHLVQLFAMAHLAEAGHKPIALIGGGTARIGDPSGKTEMRQLDPVETIQANAERMRKQVQTFLDNKTVEATVVDNAEWLVDLNYLEFLRDIGKHFSVNRMLSFETYKARMETGLSFIEFNYQLLQSYDFLVLHDRHNCLLQIGGNDQWGNIVSGSDLIRRVRGRETFGLTSPLVTRADGQKMGKTEQGAIFLDPEMCSPYEFFQYWRNVPDQDVARFLKLYTFLPVEEIQRLANLKDKEINQAKEILARELTTIVHGADEANRALQAARAAFQKSDADASALPQMEISQAELESGLRAVDLFSRTELCSSKGEARRLIEQGGARVNETKVPDIETVLDRSWLSENELLLRAGKKRYFRVIVSEE
jgi:tyrosyl-tRNA synthetase